MVAGDLKSGSIWRGSQNFINLGDPKGHNPALGIAKILGLLENVWFKNKPFNCVLITYFTVTKCILLISND